MHARLLLPLAALVALAGCATSSPKDDVANPPPTSTTPAAPQSTAQAAPDRKTLRGTLDYRKVDSSRMTTEAYLGDEILLIQESGEQTGLLASPAVTSAALEAMSGKKIEIEGTWSDGELPDPREAHPMNPDGSPMRRRAGYKVLKIRKLD